MTELEHDAAVVNAGRVTGPITGGDHGWPFGCPLFDLAERGYVMEEFFLEGDATTYRLAGEGRPTRDGHWDVESTGSFPFRTRFLVYRPAAAERFNGTVLVSWNNVTVGYELFRGESAEIFEGGYVFVAATVQHVGVHGFPTNSQGLVAWDPTRYATLSVPNDDVSYDIYAQIAMAVGPHRGATGVDPLGGLNVRRVISVGASQSASRLATFINGLHFRTHVFDAYLLQIYFGNPSPLQAGGAVVNINSAPAVAEGLTLGQAIAAAGVAGSVLLRDDLDVPIMIVNSELEAVACYGVRQADSDRMRTWEVAGASHTSLASVSARATKADRDFGARTPIDARMNRIELEPVFDAALHHLNTWIDTGDAPPMQPLIQFSGDPADVLRDRLGIAVGGVRLPQVEAPLGQNTAAPRASDIFSLLRGAYHPFDAAAIDALYPDEAEFVRQFNAAAQRAEAAGVLLPRDVAPLIDEATLEYRTVTR